MRNVEGHVVRRDLADLKVVLLEAALQAHCSVSCLSRDQRAYFDYSITSLFGQYSVRYTTQVSDWVTVASNLGLVRNDHGVGGGLRDLCARRRGVTLGRRVGSTGTVGAGSAGRSSCPIGSRRGGRGDGLLLEGVR